jgi:hypothetical protein
VEVEVELDQVELIWVVVEVEVVIENHQELHQVVIQLLL